eukprot:TRINITY_DN22465_c0_g1_i1.p2 TRINITY_DN22465_c0_g1~~TRINITY_DN22465_c0_g1_i1.p2  ORF type:complete len:410 (+),score=81.72 TRINITY_DN22465_c0_g1_i1:173-1402(+)
MSLLAAARMLTPRKMSERYGDLADAANVFAGSAIIEAAASKTDGEAGDRAVAVATSLLGICGLIALSGASYYTYDWTTCVDGGRSGLPFRLVVQVTGATTGVFFLTTFAACTAVFYPIAVARKPRPVFLHVAGSYLVLNTVTHSSMGITTWAGCAGVSYDVLRVATAFVCLVGFSSSFVLLQYSILVKVEALGAEQSESRLAESPVRRSYNRMLNPFTIGFGVVSGIVPCGLVHEDGLAWLLIVFSQGMFLVVFVMLYISFTAMAVREMRKVYLLLLKSDLSADTKMALRSQLALHAFGATIANVSTIIFFGATAGHVFFLVPRWLMFFAYGIANAAQTACALILSGLTGAVLRRNGGVALLDNSQGANGTNRVVSVLTHFAQAGRAAQSALDHEKADEEELTHADSRE